MNITRRTAVGLLAGITCPRRQSPPRQQECEVGPRLESLELRSRMSHSPTSWT